MNRSETGVIITYLEKSKFSRHSHSISQFIYIYILVLLNKNVSKSYCSILIHIFNMS